MAQTTTVNQGDILHYAREDMGGVIKWWEDVAGHVVPAGTPQAAVCRGWEFMGTLAHLAGAKVRQPEDIVAGRDIPVTLCQELVEAGTCVLARTAAPDPIPADTETPAGDASAAAPVADPPAKPAKKAAA